MDTIPETKRRVRFSINKSRVFTLALVILLIVAAGVFTDKTIRAFDAITFAWSKPQLVRPLRDQYNQETQSLQDSFIKRQMMISPVTEEELKKVMSQ